MKLLIDMNLSLALARHLERCDHDAVHWLDVGAANADDEAILIWAGEHSRTIVTSDLDFGTMLIAQGLEKPSVIQLRTELTLATMIGDLVANAISEASVELDEGAIVTIEPARLRVRRLRNDT